MSAVQAALEELKPHISYEPRPKTTFEFRDESHQVVHGIDALRQTAEASDPSEIKNLSVELDGPPSFTISGSASHGLTVKAEGSHGFAVGLVGMLAFRFAGGKEAAESMAPASVRPVEKFLYALAPVLLVAMYAFSYFVLFNYHDAVTLIGDGVLAVLVGLLPVIIAIGMGEVYLLRVGPPRFVLVKEGEQYPDDSEGRSGPIWTVRDWFKAHPAIAWVVNTAMAGVIGAMIGKGLG